MSREKAISREKARMVAGGRRAQDALAVVDPIPTLRSGAPRILGALRLQKAQPGWAAFSRDLEARLQARVEAVVARREDVILDLRGQVEVARVPCEHEGDGKVVGAVPLASVVRLKGDDVARESCERHVLVVALSGRGPISQVAVDVDRTVGNLGCEHGVVCRVAIAIVAARALPVGDAVCALAFRGPRHARITKRYARTIVLRGGRIVVVRAFIHAAHDDLRKTIQTVD